MKPELKRIEATLQYLEAVRTGTYRKQAATSDHTYSFKIRNAAYKQNRPAQMLRDDPKQTQGKGTLVPSTKEPMLPKFHSSTSSDEDVHDDSNAVLETNVLPEPETDVGAYQAEIQQIVRQIEDIYYEGPLVDGWLESYPSTPESETVTLRGEPVNRRMEYGEEVTCNSPRTGYLLCGLDASGQKWSHPCPLDQLSSVSIAIARYQKLQQLLDRKRYLQTCLQQGSREKDEK